ncbi:DNA helicase [Tanacetum coccineum]|uniref:DNA helicase n=1 Tax=Tanacetum coccineum TaxID=301880 RepID=A0ABQ4X8U1_9ASTR
MRQSPTIVGEAHIDQLSGQRHGRVCCSVSLKGSEACKGKDEANVALIKEWNDIQANIDADYQMAKQMQAKEQEELSIKEKSKLMEAQRLKEQVLCLIFQDLFGQSYERVKTLGHQNLVEGDELEQEKAKKQKVDEDKEITKLQSLMEVIPYEEEVVVDATPLATKPPSIFLQTTSEFIHNEVIGLAFPPIPDSRHASTLVSTQRKITRENVQAILVASENAPSKRTRGSIKAVGSRRPHRVTCGSGEHCSTSNSGGSTPVYDDLGDYRDKCREIDILEFKIRLYNVEGARGYEIPRSSTLRAIVFDSGPTGSTYFDVIIQDKDGSTQSISKLHPSYMSLQLNLLFIYGQSGFHTKLKLRKTLPTIRGGTCYMYAHYLDTLAICRKLGNPQFFITFTCNVNWPEIKRYMAQFLKLTTSDKADVVCQVFEQNIKLFIAFLKKERTFGHVAGILYIVEFQKHGRPHCHTLLWVDSASKIQSPEDVDRFISAKLPDLNVDPHRYKIVLEMMIHGPCGDANLSAPCMQGVKCGKKFPKKFTPKRFLTKNDMYTIKEETPMYSQQSTNSA